MNQQSTTNELEIYRQAAEQQKQQQHASGVCPSCGYCPHCGRGGYGTHPWIVPTYPVYPKLWWYAPQTWCGTTTLTFDSTWANLH